MKIKRFVAQDMRQALRMVREALGEDAVILSNKTVEGGVELTAAVDLVTEDHIDPALDAPEPSSAAAPRGPSKPRNPQRQARPREQAPAPQAEQGALSEMREEMHNLRRWLQAELATMSWYDLGQRSPHAQELLSRLLKLGLSPEIARRLSERVEGVDDLETAWRKALFFLSGELRVVDDELIDRGGLVALVGPTGVGKTTSIAKIAARYALRHGHRNVALVTTDNFRIGARDQLHTYGRILNVPVRTANDPDSMADVIDSLSDRRLVLIDTAGMGIGNDRFEEQVETLKAAGPSLTTLLTLSATTEAAALEKAMRLFAVTDPQACLLTKLDEAASLGAALSAVINAELPLAYLADGQRVPEDLQTARAQPLVNRAAELLDEFSPDDDDACVALSYKGKHTNARI